MTQYGQHRYQTYEYQQQPQQQPALTYSPSSPVQQHQLVEYAQQPQPQLVQPRTVVIKYAFAGAMEDVWSIVKTTVYVPKISGIYLQQLLAGEIPTLYNYKIRYWDSEECGYIAIRDDDTFQLHVNDKTVLMLQLIENQQQQQQQQQQQRVVANNATAAVAVVGQQQSSSSSSMVVPVVLGPMQYFRVPASGYSVQQLVTDASKHFNTSAADCEAAVAGIVAAPSSMVTKDSIYQILVKGKAYQAVPPSSSQQQSLSQSQQQQQQLQQQQLQKTVLPDWGGQMAVVEGEWGNIKIDNHAMTGRDDECVKLLFMWYERFSSADGGGVAKELPAVFGGVGIGKTKLCLSAALSPFVNASVMDRFMNGATANNNGRDQANRTAFLDKLHYSLSRCLTMGLDFAGGDFGSAVLVDDKNLEENFALTCLHFGLMKYRGYNIRFNHESYPVHQGHTTLSTFVQSIRSQYRSVVAQTPILRALCLHLTGSANHESLPVCSPSDVFRFLAELDCQNPFQKLPGIVNVTNTTTTKTSTTTTTTNLKPFVLVLDSIHGLSSEVMRRLLRLTKSLFDEGVALPVLSGTDFALFRKVADAAGFKQQSGIHLSVILSHAAFVDHLQRTHNIMPPGDLTGQLRARFEERGSMSETVIQSGDRLFLSPNLWIAVKQAFESTGGVPRLFVGLGDYLWQCAKSQRQPSGEDVALHAMEICESSYGSKLASTWDRFDPVMVLHLMMLHLLGTPLYVTDRLFPDKLLSGIHHVTNDKENPVNVVVVDAEIQGTIFTLAQSAEDGRKSIVVPELFYRSWRRHVPQVLSGNIQDTFPLLFTRHGLAEELRMVSRFSTKTNEEIFGPERQPPPPNDLAMAVLLTIMYRTRQLQLWRGSSVLMQDVIPDCPKAFQSRRMLSLHKAILQRNYPYEIPSVDFKKEMSMQSFVVRNRGDSKFADVILLAEDANGLDILLFGFDVRVEAVTTAASLAWEFLNSTLKVRREDSVDFLFALRPFAKPHQCFPHVPNNRFFEEEIIRELETQAFQAGLDVGLAVSAWKQAHSLQTGITLLSPSFFHYLLTIPIQDLASLHAVNYNPIPPPTQQSLQVPPPTAQTPGTALAPPPSRMSTPYNNANMNMNTNANINTIYNVPQNRMPPASQYKNY